MIYTNNMIKYTIKCGNDHVFESWFNNSTICDELLNKKAVECPICRDIDCSKAIMAPRISKKGRQPKSDYAQAREDSEATMNWIKSNSDDVGAEFAQEARAIYYGNKESRNIHGITTNQEIHELREEGIDVINLGPDKSKNH